MIRCMDSKCDAYEALISGIACNALGSLGGPSGVALQWSRRNFMALLVGAHDGAPFVYLGETNRGSPRPVYASGRPGDPLLILSERAFRPGERGLASARSRVAS
ncbi:hypothetical protein DEO72_LG7g274 [Vigna unguiculata]|uniref:Uncharacterized protein n=1 Tax=Vigna unguiculata TaxID=3917 RepID=A0A4D6MC95_VIGUN|nr:hypothetical protein DEO72_LG7g274 [Vigna unguiculata]